MGLETGTYISDLNSSNPAAGDPVNEGDDHIRLVKSTVKATFPSITGAVSATHTELNKLDGVTANTAELNYVDVTALGTAQASKAVTADANKDITGVRNLTVTGTLTVGSNAVTTIQAVYPIGSIYINAAVATNPGTLLGFGTWVVFGTGKVMVGFDTNDADFNTVQETGGAKTHTLSISEMPSHNHSVTMSTSDQDNGNLSEGNTSGTSSFNTTSTGGGAAHNNVQPYIVVHMWRRTA